MEWIGEAEIGRGVREQGFRVVCEGRSVPGILWTTESGGEGRPLALLGHGGTLHKRADYILATARRLVRHHGISAIAIDGPGHGDRRKGDRRDGDRRDGDRRDGDRRKGDRREGDRRESEPGELERARQDFDSVWERPAVTDETIADWKVALDAVQLQLGEGPVGYFGLSMGTMMGLPLVVAEPRVRAAVLGLMGAWGPTADRLVDDAGRLGCPVRFLVQWDDEIVPRDTALALFDRLGSKNKSLRAHPGRHVEVPPDEMRAIPDYLASHLT